MTPRQHETAPHPALGLPRCRRPSRPSSPCMWHGSACDFGSPSTCRGSIANGSLAERSPSRPTRARTIAPTACSATSPGAHLRARQGAQRHARRLLPTSPGSHPDLRFVYAETSWPWGGNFAPAQDATANGTSVDFHVPTRTDGQVSELPHLALQPVRLFGGVRRRRPRAARSLIDFEAMGLHLLALDKAARANGTRIQRVIFDPSPALEACRLPRRRPGPGPPRPS